MAGNHHALLIGIDFYLPNNINGGEYPSLKGCVRDVGGVEEFLKTRIGIRDENIVKLTSTRGPDGRSLEPPERRPSYENIVAALQTLIGRLEREDLVYVHYSGHGGRTKTSIPQVKGATARDETLVPFDIGDTAARYIRDHELALLFKTMVDKGIIATLVMDCCHSGGLTRGPDVGIRGVEFVDQSIRDAASLVGSPDELAECWIHSVGLQARNLVSSERNPGYTMLAACRPTELAKEYAFDGQNRMGALTYWTLDTLQQSDGNTSWKVVHDRVCQKVRAQFSDQTPMLLGDSTRTPFGSNRETPVFAIPIASVSYDQQRITLGSGQAAGLRTGSQFCIYPRGTLDFSDVGSRIALVEVTDVGAVQSESRIVDRYGTRSLDVGDQAILLTAPVKLIKKVRFVSFDDSNPQHDVHLFRRIREALLGNGWVEEVATDDEPAQFKVMTDQARKAFLICQPDGNTPLNLRPVVNVDEPNAAHTIVQRLQHLARFEAVRSIDNFSSTSPLRNKVAVELLLLPNDFEDGADDPNQVGTLIAGNPIRLKAGQKVCLRISNNSASVLNIAILDLQPDWGITQVYPAGDFEPLDPRGTPIFLTLNAFLPEGSEHGTDIIKVFATLQATTFRGLELPPLDRPAPVRRSLAVRGDALGTLFSQIEQSRGPRTRNINVSGAPREWTTSQLEILVE